MKEITKDQSIALAKSKFWEHMTPEDIARFQLNTERLCMPFEVFHEAVTKALGRSVFTHEFANAESLLAELDGAKPRSTIQEIIELIPESKRILVAA